MAGDGIGSEIATPNSVATMSVSIGRKRMGLMGSSRGYARTNNAAGDPFHARVQTGVIAEKSGVRGQETRLGGTTRTPAFSFLTGVS
jgi:hypothetical protein